EGARSWFRSPPGCAASGSALPEGRSRAFRVSRRAPAQGRAGCRTAANGNRWWSSEEIRMPRYVDGFVIPVPKAKLAAYRRMSRRAGVIWREFGALEYRECVEDDVKMGKLTS